MEVASAETVENVAQEITAQRTEHEIEEATATITAEVEQVADQVEEATAAAETAAAAAEVAAAAASDAAVVSMATAVTEDALAERVAALVTARMQETAPVLEPVEPVEPMDTTEAIEPEIDETPRNNSWLHRKAF